MSTTTREQRLERRIEDLTANDPQFAAARPDPAVAAAVGRPGLRLPQIVQTVLDGYADRPALGQRAVEFFKDPKTGRTVPGLLPRFDTITYRELGERVDALARALTQDGLQVGDRVAALGFNSVDFTTIDIALGRIGAVAVPLQTSAAITGLQPIVTETEPTAFAVSVNQLPDAVELILTSEHKPAKVVVFDYHPEVDDEREAVESARTKLSDVPVESLADLLERGKTLPATPAADVDDDELALLIYTSGSTGAPKGAMYPRRNVGKMWCRSSRNWFGETPASITLNFMPMSHVMGRGILYGSLGNGGTAYFAARSDLSTLLEDLELVRPTEMNFVPRIWETLHGEYLRQVGRGDDPAQVMDDMRQYQLGGRFIFAMTGSAPTSPELKTWVETCSTCTCWTATALPKPAWCCSTANFSARRSSTTSWPTSRIWATSPPTVRIRGASCCSRPRTCSPATTSGPRPRQAFSTKTGTTAPETSSPRSRPTRWCTSTAATTC